MINLPDEFVDRMKALLGDEFDAFYSELNNPNIKGYRVNTIKAKGNDLSLLGDEKIPYTENGYYLTYEKAGNHPYHHSGGVYIQEPAAMMPCESVDISPHWAVLDMCAAPGGKSTKIAEKLGEKGVLVSNEISMSRCKVLTGNIERMGIKNAVVTSLDSGKIAELFPNRFDLIIVDAPCSGEGMFRKEQAAIDDWSIENVKSCALRQRQILENAAKCLKDGGIIVYSTCTFSTEENEETVDYFLKEHPDFRLQKPLEKVMAYSSPGVDFEGCTTENINYCRRLYPHKNRGEGQFFAVLKNTLPRNESYSAAKNKKDKLPEVVTDFLKSTLREFDEQNFYVKGDKVTYFAPDFAFDTDKAYTYGVTVGEIKKNYILPHHQFFSCFGKDFLRKVDFAADSYDISRYLLGDTVDCNLKNGWAVVTVDGMPLGGIKVSDGVGKNHYPKGLRNLY